MVEDLLTSVERRVIGADVQGANIEMCLDQARSLLATGQYRASFGAPLGALHYRRPLADGSCLHLIVGDDKVLLHCDRFDPERDLTSLAMHVLTEGRNEALEFVSTAWLVLRLIAR